LHLVRRAATRLVWLAMKGYTVGDIEVLFTDIQPPEHDNGIWHYDGLHEEKVVLSKGHRKLKDSLALPCDIVFDRDVPVPLRDGVRVRVDIYRPTTSDDRPVPCIVAYSPYGKVRAVRPAR
jgi:hypothetical protein